MKKKASKYHQLNTFSLMDEGLYLLRAGGTDAAVYYYAGTLPFMLTFLFFWHDMAQSRFAAERMVSYAFLMAVAFIWMKVSQTFFCRRLWELRAGLEPTGFRGRNIIQTLLNQVMIQPLGILLIPLSMLLALPFGSTHAFFQNYSVMDNGGPPREIIRQSFKQARLWPLQNHLLIWILSPWLLGAVLLLCFGGAAFVLYLAGNNANWLMTSPGELPWILLGTLVLVLGVWPSCPLAVTVAINIGMLIWICPHLLNSFFGVETIFVRSGIYAIANSTVLLSIYVLTYMILDPIMKSTYVLRCFYGDSAATGADLLADLKKPGIMLLGTALAFSIFTSPAQAQEPQTTLPDAQSVQVLDQAIEKTLQNDEYALRIDQPRRTLSLSLPFSKFEIPLLTPVTQWIGKGFKWLGNKIEQLFEWLRKLLFKDREKKEPADPVDMTGTIKVTVYLLIFALLLLGGWQLFKVYRQRRNLNKQVAITVEEVPPDLTQEDVHADMLPEAQWLEMADQMLAQNKPRLALRALYLAGLACLGHWRIIRLEPYKSNCDYKNEISRFRSSYPDLARLFMTNAHLFEKVWYGDYPVKDEYLSECRKNQNLMRGCFAEN